jgi:hypothetical protein
MALAQQPLSSDLKPVSLRLKKANPEPILGDVSQNDDGVFTECFVDDVPGGRLTCGDFVLLGGDAWMVLAFIRLPPGASPDGAKDEYTPPIVVLFYPEKRPGWYAKKESLCSFMRLMDLCQMMVLASRNREHSTEICATDAEVEAVLKLPSKSRRVPGAPSRARDSASSAFTAAVGDGVLAVPSKVLTFQPDELDTRPMNTHPDVIAAAAAAPTASSNLSSSASKGAEKFAEDAEGDGVRCEVSHQIAPPPDSFCAK